MPSELRCKLRACVRAFVLALRYSESRLRGEAAGEVEVANEVEGEVCLRNYFERGGVASSKYARKFWTKLKTERRKKLLCCPS